MRDRGFNQYDIKALYLLTSSFLFRRTGFFELQTARDKYRELCGAAGMHVDLVFEYIRRQALLLSPLCPHVCEYIWSLLNNKGSILHSQWPTVGEIDELNIK